MTHLSDSIPKYNTPSCPIKKLAQDKTQTKQKLAKNGGNGPFQLIFMGLGWYRAYDGVVTHSSDSIPQCYTPSCPIKKKRKTSRKHSIPLLSVGYLPVSEEEVGELALVHLDPGIPKSSSCLWLGHAARAHGRVRKHHGRHVRVVRLNRRAQKQRPLGAGGGGVGKGEGGQCAEGFGTLSTEPYEQCGPVVKSSKF